MTTLLLNGWPRTITEIMATATKFMKFSSLIFCLRYNSSLTNSTQFGNNSNYSKFNGENIATNCSRVTVLALDALTKKHFGHYALLKIFSLRSPSALSSFLKSLRNCDLDHLLSTRNSETQCVKAAQLWVDYFEYCLKSFNFLKHQSIQNENMSRNSLH